MTPDVRNGIPLPVPSSETAPDPYQRPEAVEMREAYLALEAAKARWEASVAAMTAAGWRPVGWNTWEPPAEVASSMIGGGERG